MVSNTFDFSGFQASTSTSLSVLRNVQGPGWVQAGANMQLMSFGQDKGKRKVTRERWLLLFICFILFDVVRSLCDLRESTMEYSLLVRENTLLG